jgi:hypothetical protein
VNEDEPGNTKKRTTLYVLSLFHPHLPAPACTRAYTCMRVVGGERRKKSPPSPASVPWSPMFVHVCAVFRPVPTVGKRPQGRPGANRRKRGVSTRNPPTARISRKATARRPRGNSPPVEQSLFSWCDFFVTPKSEIKATQSWTLGKTTSKARRAIKLTCQPKRANAPIGSLKARKRSSKYAV